MISEASKHLTCRGLREDENEMEDRSSRRMRTLVTRMVHRDLSAKKNACALISMMARSSNRSNQRPDTLMQDRNADKSTKPSCDARPDHTSGQSETFRPT